MPRASQPQPVAPPNLFAGTSGWAYSTWKPGFYPEDVSARNFLQYYASQFNSVEVNYTFRKLPTEKQLQAWLDATPPHFQFSFKAPQAITHFQRLRESSDAVTEFVQSLKLARSAGKIGPLLFQLPPNFKVDHARIAAFLKTPALRSRNKTPAPRIAFEFRNESWFVDDTYDILRHHNAALCVAESDDLATPDIHTADFACYRLRCNGFYSRPTLKKFAERFTALAKTTDVYAYFKHEEAPTGALNARTMLRCATGAC